MPEEELQPEAPEKDVPKDRAIICPYCDADPVELEVGPITWPNGIRAAIFSCKNCRKIVPGFLLPAAPPQRPMIVPPGGGPRIIPQ